MEEAASQTQASCTHHSQSLLHQWPSSTTQPQISENRQKLQVYMYLGCCIQDFFEVSEATLPLPSHKCFSEALETKIMHHKSCNISHRTWNSWTTQQLHTFSILSFQEKHNNLEVNINSKPLNVQNKANIRKSTNNKLLSKPDNDLLISLWETIIFTHFLIAVHSLFFPS